MPQFNENHNEGSPHVNRRGERIISGTIQTAASVMTTFCLLDGFGIYNCSGPTPDQYAEQGKVNTSPAEIVAGVLACAVIFAGHKKNANRNQRSQSEMPPDPFVEESKALRRDERFTKAAEFLGNVRTTYIPGIKFWGKF